MPDRENNVSVSTTSLTGSSAALVATPDYARMAQELFVIYFGRPATPWEVDNWADNVERFVTQGHPDTGHDIFGSGMPELYARFAGLDNAGIVNQAFMQLFNHYPPMASLAFWKDKLDSGAVTTGGLLRALATGAQSTDLLALQNKIDAAQAFTGAARDVFELHEDIDAESSIDYLGAVDTNASLDAARASLPALMAEIAALPENIWATGTVAITGKLAVGETLSATHTLVDPDGMGPIVYLWYAGYELVQSTTSKTLLLTEEHAGKSLWVSAAFVDGRGGAASVGSDDTVPVRMTAAAQAVEKAYVEYLGRPADAAALEHWSDIIATRGDNGLKELRSALVATPEFAKLFAGKDAAQQVQQVFQTLLGRPADEAGLDYWSDVLSRGLVPIAVVIRGVADGAQGQDRTVLENKAWAAETFTAALNDPYLKSIYAGYDAYDLGRTFVARVTDTASRDTAMGDAQEAAYALYDLAPNEYPSFSYRIAGQVATGNTLVLEFIKPIDDPDGAGPLSYQWKANGVAIPGATADRYVVAAAHAGATITVSFSYTDARGFEHSFDSHEVQGDQLHAGTTGADTLAGGIGNDTYTINHAGDLIVEKQYEGVDTALVNLAKGGTYVLGAHVENGTAGAGKAVINLTGNDLHNILTGNDAANTLIGGAGSDQLNGGGGKDILIGGADNDYYTVDSATDVVTELANEGTDTVTTAAATSFVLGAHVENLYYTGKGAFSGTGNDLANTLQGAVGNDKLSGLGGDDLVFGLGGDDQLDGGSGNDRLVGGEGNDKMLGGDGADQLWGEAGNDTLDGGLGNDQLMGGIGNDVLLGGEGDDVLSVQGGNDLADGGAGTADWAMVGGAFADYQRKRPNATDTVLVHKITGETITLRNIEHVGFADGARTIAVVHENIATGGNDALTGTDEDDLLDGGLGNDSMAGGLGNDRYVVNTAGDTVVEANDEGIDEVAVAFTAKGSYTLAANVEHATVTAATSIAVNLEGNALDNDLIGNGASNVINGGAGNDYIDGGAGKDTMSGGVGDDLFIVDNAGDIVRELADGGIDTVVTALASYTVGAEVEDLIYSGDKAFTGTGNAGGNFIAGGKGNDKLSGLAGDDALVGAEGNDTLLGGDGRDYLAAGTGNDVLDGGAGEDLARITGPLDDYVRVRTSLTDTVLTNAERGERITLRNVEFVTDGTTVWSIDQVNANLASAGNDTLLGSDGDDLIDGGAGSDSMAGGDGDDLYLLDVLTDSVSEAEDEGTDTVVLGFKGAASYTLGDNVENATVTAAGAINVTGNALDNELRGGAGVNVLNGGAGDDLLDGGAGKDVMTGGAGDDVYVVDIVGDVVNEAVDGGYDVVRTNVASYTLTANVEALEYTGTKAFTGIGSASDNYIAGGAGADKLSGGAGHDYLNGGAGNDSLDGGIGDDRLGGGAGNDTLLGGAGNDELFVGTGIDIVDGGADEDILYLDGNLADYVRSRASATELLLVNAKTGENVKLRNVEKVVFGETVKTIDELLADRGTSANDVLVGTDGDDVLDGGAGVDTMTGGLGDDTYVVSIATDSVVEAPDEGVDLVEVAFTAKGTYVLAANVEDAIIVSGATLAVNLTGNALGNQLTGNAAANTLSGGGGDDTLSGGLGNDILAGGAGSDLLRSGAGKDIFVLDSADGLDTLADFASASDKLRVLQKVYRIGDGDAVVEGGLVRAAAGGFTNKAELVIFSTNIVGELSAEAAAAAIGSATSAYAQGAQVLFVVDNGSDSAVFLFTSSGADATVSADELTQVAELLGTPSTVLADYTFAL